jgi:hypothetical protein
MQRNFYAIREAEAARARRPGHLPRPWSKQPRLRADGQGRHAAHALTNPARNRPQPPRLPGREGGRGAHGYSVCCDGVAGALEYQARNKPPRRRWRLLAGRAVGPLRHGRPVRSRRVDEPK